MNALLHELIFNSAQRQPDDKAVVYKEKSQSYEVLASELTHFAMGLLNLGLARQERVAIYLPKQIEAVVAMFGTVCAGAVFVPINPLLKANQVVHILRDCNVRILVTSGDRAKNLVQVISDCHDLHTVVLVGVKGDVLADNLHLQVIDWASMIASNKIGSVHRVIDTDMAGIFYTSGSTGKPKGVVLSHRNFVAGAESVAHYLQNNASDRILAVLPFSFDYGFNQLSTAFQTGACIVLMDYLLPKDVIRAAEKEKITGIAGVPPLWTQIAQRSWPQTVVANLRYITNSGGVMPKATLKALRAALPETKIYLMYGLTEAFRSTYLPPEELDKRPDSIGKAIPNAEIMVVREDGSLCAPGESGELVHRGPLVALGYWNDIEKTAERFKPAPYREKGLVLTEVAVWSGDTVRTDEDGYLYFVGRRDDMIKSSGYRVSPTEVEEVVYGSGLVHEAAAIGVYHPNLGQAVVVVATPKESGLQFTEELYEICRNQLPNFMVPQRIEWRTDLPRNPNGKLDRRKLATELQDLFEGNML